MKTADFNSNKQQASRNKALGIYILSITLVVVSYSVATVINFL